MIEVDLLLAYLVSEDKHHEVASFYFSKVVSGELEKPKVTPLALQELELGVRAEKILPHGRVVKSEGEVAEFMREICEALQLYEIEILPLECTMFASAADIRKAHDLSYYDSHHASAALAYDKSIISTDRQYDRVRDLNRIDPYRFSPSRGRK